MAIVTPFLYCTPADVVGILGAVGELAIADDNGDGVLNDTELGYVTFAIGDASTTIDFCCYALHTQEMLQTSPWVNNRCAWLACYALCERRGNEAPDAIAEKCERIQDELDAIADGRRQVPALARRMSGAPLWSNVRADPTFLFRVLRVEKKQSSDKNSAANQSKLPRNIDYQDSWTAEL